MEPLNYDINVAQPFQSVLQGFQGGLGISNAIQQQQLQQQQIQQQRQMQQDLMTLASNKNASGTDYAQLMTRYPQISEALKRANESMTAAQQQGFISTHAPILAAARGGNPDVAEQKLRDLAAAKRNSGDEQGAKEDEVLAETFRLHPDSGIQAMAFRLSALPGGDKIVDSIGRLGQEQRAAALASNEQRIKESEARIKEAEAQGAPRKVAADIANTYSLINERAGRLGLDRDRLNSEYGLKVKEFLRKPGAVDLPESAISMANSSASNAVVARQTSAQLADLATQFEQADPHSFAGGFEWLKTATGQQDYVSSLRKEYTRLMSGEVNKMLPPGSASDADVNNARAGFPKENANPEQLVSFMRGLSKLQAYQAQIEDAKGEWVTSVGHLQKTGRDIEIGGVTVPAGTTFSEFIKRTLKPIGATTQPPAAGIKARLLQTYGGTSGVNASQD